MEREERELIERVLGGDKMAFKGLMDRYGERVMNLAYQLTRNYQDAEDLYQETFLKVYCNLPNFRFESELFTWIYRIVVNQAFNLYHRKKRFTVLDQDEEENFWETIPDETVEDGEDKEISKALQEEIDRAMRTLSPQQRVVFILKYVEDKKIKDIAAILECSEGTVKRYLFRATKKLKAILARS